MQRLVYLQVLQVYVSETTGRLDDNQSVGMTAIQTLRHTWFTACHGCSRKSNSCTGHNRMFGNPLAPPQLGPRCHNRHSRSHREGTRNAAECGLPHTINQSSRSGSGAESESCLRFVPRKSDREPRRDHLMIACSGALPQECQSRNARTGQTH